MENVFFILGDTDINILNNGQNILDKYKDMNKRKSNFGVSPKKYAEVCSTLGLKHLIKYTTAHSSIQHFTAQLLLITLLATAKKRLLKVVLSTLHYLTISLFFALGKSRE